MVSLNKCCNCGWRSLLSQDLARLRFCQDDLHEWRATAKRVHTGGVDNCKGRAERTDKLSNGSADHRLPPNGGVQAPADGDKTAGSSRRLARPDAQNRPDSAGRPATHCSADADHGHWLAGRDPTLTTATRAAGTCHRRCEAHVPPANPRHRAHPTSQVRPTGGPAATCGSAPTAGRQPVTDATVPSCHDPGLRDHRPESARAGHQHQQSRRRPPQ
jgi:hypothetical protein